MFRLHCPKLLIGALLLGCISTARADQATYNLQTYTFPDILNPSFTDTLSGTLTLTNSAGSVFTTYNAGDSSLANVTISMSLKLQSSSNTIAPVTVVTSPPVSIGANVIAPSNYLFSGSLTATPSGLSLSNPGYLNFDYNANGSSDPPYITGHWDTAAGDDGGAMSFFGSGLNTTGGATMQVFPQNLDSQLAPEFGPGAWLIAVPEPSTMLLLSVGAIGFLMRRRGTGKGSCGV